MEQKNYTMDIKTSISKMEDLLCSYNRNDEDKTSCISCFVADLRAHSFGLDETVSSELICAKDSYARTKKQLTHICSEKMIAKEEYDEGIRLCALQEENCRLLYSGGNSGIDPIGNEISAARKVLAERFRLGQLWKKVIVYDKQIEKEIAELGKPSSPPFDDVEKHISSYGEMLSDLSDNGIDISQLTNNDTSSLLKTVNDIRALFAKKQSEMERVSGEIRQLETVWQNDEKNIYSIIERVKYLSDMKEECLQKGWSIPQLSCGELSDLLEKYGLYAQMIELDKSISSTQENIVDPEGLVLEQKCKQQLNNVRTCERCCWELPRLSVDNLSEIIGCIQVERENRNKLLSKTVDQVRMIINSVNALRNGSSVAFKRTKAQIDEFERLLGELKGKNIPTDSIPNIEVEGIRSQIDELEAVHDKKKYLSAMRSNLKEQDEELSRIIAELDRLPNFDYQGLFERIAKFDNTLSLCKQNGINVDKIKNRDVVQLKSFVSKSKEKCEHRSNLYKNMVERDYELCRLLPAWREEKDSIDKIIALATEQLNYIEECKTNGWQLPLLKCPNIPLVKDRFNIYKFIMQIDNELYRIKDTQTYYSAKHIVNLCNQQLNNLKTCANNRWETPVLLVTNLEMLRKTNRAYCRRRDFRISAIVAGMTISAIVIIILVTSIKGNKSSSVGKNSKNNQFSQEMDNRQRQEESARLLSFPFSFSEVEGKDYTEIEETIRGAGFENVTCKSSNDGICQSSSVIDLTIDGNKCDKIECRSDSTIEIVYASENRIEITNVLSNWNIRQYDYLEQSLKAKGLEIHLNEVKSYNPDHNSKVHSLVVNGVHYESGACFVPPGITVEISFYENVIEMQYGSAYIVGSDYLDVRKKLVDLGFKNIEFVRDDDLSWDADDFNDLTVNRLVASITIDGKSTFHAGDIFPEKAAVVIHVHTYKYIEYDYM